MLKEKILKKEGDRKTEKTKTKGLLAGTKVFSAMVEKKER